MKPEEYALQLALAIGSSSLSPEDQQVLISKLEQGKFTQHDLDHVLSVMEQDINSLEYAAKVMEDSKQPEQNNQDSIPSEVVGE